jgi:choline dehydrogenase-like flavoprotein
MLRDLDQLPEGTEIACDVCIVGSGAAGIALAVGLLDSKLNVVVLESGGAIDEPATQRLYDSEVVGHAFPGAHEGRFRTYGGSTTRWGGSGIPLDPSDFERRRFRTRCTSPVSPGNAWSIPFTG